MKSRKDLHQLIHSLTAYELRAIRQYIKTTSAGTGEKAILLLDALAGMEEDDDRLLRSILEGEKMLNQLPVAKKGLTEMILKVLTRLEETESIDGKLRRILSQVEVLFKRNLWAEAHRRIAKGMQLALAHDKLSQALELLKWKIKLHKKTGKATDFEQIQKWQNEEENLLQQMQDEAKLRRAHDDFFTFLSLGGQSANKIPRFYPNAVLQEDIFQKPVQQLHFNAQIIWHYVHVYAHQYRGDWAGVKKHYAQMLELWEDNPHRMQEEMDRYLITLISYLDSFKASISSGTLAERIQHMRGLSLKTKALAAKVFHYSYHLELTYAIHKGQMPFSPDFEEKIMAGVTEFGGLIDSPAKMSFYSNLAILYFIHGQFSRSLHWLNQIHLGGETKLREDIRQFIRCLQLANQFELGHGEVVAYGAEALRKSQSRKESEIPLLAIFSKYILQLLQYPQPQIQRVWQTFYAEMSALRTSQKLIPGTESLVIWSQSHATQRTMIDCIQDPSNG